MRDVLLGEFALVLIHDSQAHPGRPFARPGVYGAEQKRKERRETKDPEEISLVRHKDAQVFQGQCQQLRHQSLSLLPVRFRNTSSRLAVSTFAVRRWMPLPFRAARVSRGLLVCGRIMFPSRLSPSQPIRPAHSSISSGTRSPPTSTCDGPPCLAIQFSTVSMST